MSRDEQPTGGSMVVLLSDPYKEGRFDLLKMATSGEDGRFTLKDVGPGSYKLYAWGDIEPGSHLDPEMLAKYDSKAQKVAIKANAQEQVTLTQIVLEQ